MSECRNECIYRVHDTCVVLIAILAHTVYLIAVAPWFRNSGFRNLGFRNFNMQMIMSDNPYTQTILSYFYYYNVTNMSAFINGEYANKYQSMGVLFCRGNISFVNCLVIFCFGCGSPAWPEHWVMGKGQILCSDQSFYNKLILPSRV